MATAIESGIGTLNFGRQTAKGSIATAATVTTGYDRPRWAGGALGSKKSMGSEEYVDGLRFGSPSQFTDKVGGDVGTITVQVQPENAGLYLGQILGVDTVSGASDPYTHTSTSNGVAGGWGTWWQKTGSTIGPERELYSDTKIGKLTFMAGVSQKVAHFDMDLVSLNPGQIFTTDAAKTEATTDPYIWTEITGAVTFDGTVISDVMEEALTIDPAISAFYGDSIVPSQLIEGKGTITSSIKTIVTDVTLAKYQIAVYGSSAPTAGTLPIKTVYYAALNTTYTRSATRTLTIQRPKIAVDPSNMVLGALPVGGTIELDFGGVCLKSGATAAVTTIVLSGDATTYA